MPAAVALKYFSGSGVIHALAFSRDGSLLAGGGTDGRVRVWEISTGRVRRETNAGFPIHSLAWSPTSDILAVGGIGGSVAIVSPDSESPMKLAGIDSGDLVSGTVFSEDGETVTAVSSGGQVAIWDLGSGRIVRKWAYEPDQPDLAAVGPPGRHALFYGDQFGFRFVELETGSEVGRFATSVAATCIALDDDECTAAFCTADGELTVGRSRNSEPISFRRLGKHAHAVAFSPKADASLAVAGGSVVELFNLRNGSLTTTLETGARTRCAAFSPDSRFLASGGDGPVMVWERLFWSARTESQRVQSPASAIAIAPSGRVVALGTYDGSISLHAAHDRRFLRTLHSGESPVVHLGFASDGCRIAAGSEDGAVTLWDAITGDSTFRTPAFGAPVRHVCFSPDGLKVAACYKGGMVRTFSARSCELIVERDEGWASHRIAFRGDGTASSVGSNVRKAAVSADSRFLAVNGPAIAQITVQNLYSLDSEVISAGIEQSHELLSALAFSAEGRFLAAAYSALPQLALGLAEAVSHVELFGNRNLRRLGLFECALPNVSEIGVSVGGGMVAVLGAQGEWEILHMTHA